MTEVNPLATLQGFEWGANLMSDRLDRDARQRAGQALSQGDYGAAGQELGGRGMLEEQIAVQGYGQEQEQGAQAQFQAFLGNVLTSMEGVPEAQRPQQWQAVRSTFQQLYPPEDFARLDQIAQSPGGLSDANLALVRGAMGGGGAEVPEPRYYNTRDGVVMVTPEGTGSLVYRNVSPQVTPRGLLTPDGGMGGTEEDEWDYGPPSSPSQPGGGQPRPGSERSQTPTVSFGNSNEARNAINRIVPGVRFTSGPRTPAQNQAAGGAARSYHLSNRAWDLVPPQGMTMAQLADLMRQQGFRVLNEGDHVHVSW